MAHVVKNPVVTGVRRLFLLVSPNETSFERLEDVPNYVDEAVPYFIGMVLLEWTVLLLKGKKIRLNDGLGNLSNGLLSLLHSLLFRSTELAGFMWVHSNYKMVTLPWSSPWTWLVSLLSIDLAYYWVHRCAHEVNIMWAGHQTHHSSQEYNFTTALRQSLLQKYYAPLFYLPCGLFMPPSTFLVHLQFNLIYQFWVHTETVGRLGPLEWILSTPSHHRVHHGRNPYCIDKNYGAVFIIWDRLFGTFEAERDEDRPVYGLVHNIDSWEPVYAQLHHYKYLVKTAWSIEGLNNKLSVFLKGPGWAPGKPRLGLKKDLPEIEENPVKYDIDVPVWNSVYLWAHYLILLVIYTILGMSKASISTAFMSSYIVFMVISLSIFGAMYDNRRHSDVFELLRCVAYVAVTSVTGTNPVPQVLVWVYTVSALFWSIVLAGRKMTGNKEHRKPRKLKKKN